MGDTEDIYRLLDELSESEFKRFKHYLGEQTLDGFTPIPWGRLEKADTTDIVRMMMDRYEVEGRMTITQHILKSLGRRDPTQQLQQISADFSTGVANQTVSGAGTGVTQDIHTLGLGSSEAGNRLSSASTSSTLMSSNNTSPTGRRKWIPCSKKWREQMEELSNMEDSKVRRVGGLTFVPNDERFRIALMGQTEVLLGLKKDGTEVAIKKMLISNYKKFQDELKVLQGYRFNSLHVVQYVDSEDEGDIGYIAMQLCDYNLEEYIKKQPAEPERKRIVKEFLEGLKDIHEHPKAKLIHRDIKPQNILIDADDGVRFADFGISRTLEPGQTTRVTGRVGTDYWEATEIVRNPPGDQGIRYKRSADIQVAGMLVYYILSGGKHPFGDDIRCISNIYIGDYQLQYLNDDEEAKDLLESMLNVNPDARPQITEVLSHPYFWDKSSKESFLIQVGNVPEVKNYDESGIDEEEKVKLEEVLNELEVDKKSFSTWKTRLDHVTDEHIKNKWLKLVQTNTKEPKGKKGKGKKEESYPETLLCLLRFIRNCWILPPSEEPDVMEKINVMKLFPDLVLTAYKLDKKRGWKINKLLPSTPPNKRKAESSSTAKVGGKEPDAPPQKKTRREPSLMDVDEPSPRVSAPSLHKNPGQNFFFKNKAALETRLPTLQPILILLQQRQVLNDHERELVTSKSTSTQQNYALLTMIQNKGPTAQQVFFEVLKRVDPFLIQDLILRAQH
ncbi:serine/threonine-protein kinase/endoribonuclease IRE2-like isoform X3 [Alosa sapidissima]|uniref:serine/threonine-protein kinase/endoribonuclease IRE2-like isoform X3 n=1 Tax=Alosa sapidissima TaxID=34773 RepID=UPI001C07FF15|nr:serine/threonine-protein kinase/endoribonuclease IRE2-like isoform X3 [Alosa sapidissima]